MAQRSQMYYAYFRFYVDEATIEAGLNSYCTEWEHMFEVGYNYKEYKCFVDNLGGFEHFVGDMRGYISQTRETGFLDGSPSDSVFDQSLLMGAERIFVDDVELLNGYAPSTRLVFRKITAEDAGVAHKIKFTCGNDQTIEHPIMYVLDSTQTEIIDQVAAGIVDTSDVDGYTMMVEASKQLSIGSQYSLSYGTVTDFDLAFNRSYNDFMKITTPHFDTTTAYLIIDFGATFTNISIDLYNYKDDGANGNTITSIHYSDNPAGGWTLLGTTGLVDGHFKYHAVGLSARYVRITSQPSANWRTRTDIYRLMCS